MARGWKRGVEWLAARSGLANAAARGKRPATAILAYHNIIPSGEPVAGDVSLHVDQGVFADQLDFLLETHDVVPLESARDALPEPGDRSRVVLTFDDAYRGSMTAGVEELRSRRLPATVFVPPGLLGASGFWWDRLAPPNGHPLSAAVRAHALESLEGRQDRILEWAASQSLSAHVLPTHALPADEKTLLDGATYERLTLGAHTWTHPNLAALSMELVRLELEQSKSWLLARAPRYIEWFAYPYGLRTPAVVAEAASRFEGALLIEGGLAQARGGWATSGHELPRLNVPRGLTLDGLALRLAGLLR